MLLNPKEFADFLIERKDAHDGYIMCATGQDPKKWAVTSWWFTQYDDDREAKAKALYWREHAERVWDCQGLSDGYVSEKTGTKVNVKARDNYATWCGVKGVGKIPNDKKCYGAAVFRSPSTASSIEHVGYLVKPVTDDIHGDWWVVEARGVRYGVVMTKLSERTWTHWGYMTKYFNYGPVDVNVNTEEKRPLVKRGSKGEHVTALQNILIQLGYSLPKYGADGDFGDETLKAVKMFQTDNDLEVDGIVGEKTWAALNDMIKARTKTENPKPEAGDIIVRLGTWNVRAEAHTGSVIYGYAHGGDSYKTNGQTQEGWTGIIYKNLDAWLSNKAIEK